MLVNLWVPLSSGVLEGLGRYCTVLFPLAMIGATIPSPTGRHAVTAFCGAVYVLGLALFTNVHPIF